MNHGCAMVERWFNHGSTIAQQSLNHRSTMSPSTTPDPCAARHLGAAESCDAWRRLLADLPERRAAVLAEIASAGPEGMTVIECAAALATTPNVVSGRFTELRAAGLIRRRGDRRGDSAVHVVVRRESETPHVVSYGPRQIVNPEPAMFP